MYEVALHTEPGRLLDWDKPLAPRAAPRDALYEAARPASSSVYGDTRSQAFEALRQSQNPNLTGEGLHHQLAKVLGGKEQAAAALRELGLDGIQYLDAGSRGAGQGTRNYVINNADLIEILRQYGIIGAVGGGAAAAAGQGERAD